MDPWVPPGRCKGGGLKIGGLRRGEGEPVVLLHCSSSSGAQWRQLVDRLADRFEVHAPDLIGYGDTDAWPADASLTPEDEIALVRHGLDDPEVPIHLVGHSYGGLIALRAALAGGLRPKSLTLIEPIAFWLLREAGDDIVFAEIMAIGTGFNAGLDAGDPVSGVRTYFDYWNGMSAWDSAPEDLRAYVLRTAPKTYKEWPNAFEPTTPLAAFAGLDVPTMLIRGLDTRAPTARVVELLAGVLPRACTKEIPGAGHMSPITHVDDVNVAIDAFVVGEAR